MAVTPDRPHHLVAVHPLHAFFTAGMVPLFLGALITDWTYANSYHIQWSNFSSWLIVGGMVLCGIVLVLSIVDLVRHRAGRSVLYFLVVLATFVLGFINALVHGQDAWAIMPEAPILSLIVFVLAALAAWLAFAGRSMGGVR